MKHITSVFTMSVFHFSHLGWCGPVTEPTAVRPA